MSGCKHGSAYWIWQNDAAVARTCLECGAWLSLGPANDSVKPAPLPRREMANFRDHDAWSWDPSRPIAEQLAETARDDAAAEDALCLKSQHDSDPGKLAQLMADDGHTALTIRQYTGLVEVGIDTADAEPDCTDENDVAELAREVGLMPSEAFDAGCGRVETALGAETARVDARVRNLSSAFGSLTPMFEMAARDAEPDRRDEEDCDHRGTWSPDASVSECPKCLKQWRTSDDTASRDVEPDCRDEDDAPAVTSTIQCTLTAAERRAALERLSPTPRYDDEGDEPTDPTTKFGHLANQVTVPVLLLGRESERKPMSTGPATSSPEVCACTGDALLSETCEVAP